MDWLVSWLCFTSLRLRGHLKTAPPFTVPCEGREAQYKGMEYLISVESGRFIYTSMNKSSFTVQSQIQKQTLKANTK